MMSDIMTTVKGWLGIARNWWGTLSPSQQMITAGCVGVVLIAYAGGLVLQGFLIGVVVNAGFWYGFWSPKMVTFMQKAGILIDVVVTIGVFAIGGAHGMVAGVCIAAIFSVCRRNLIPKVVKAEVAVESQPVKVLENSNV